MIYSSRSQVGENNICILLFCSLTIGERGAPKMPASWLRGGAVINPCFIPLLLQDLLHEFSVSSVPLTPLGSAGPCDPLLLLSLTLILPNRNVYAHHAGLGQLLCGV